MIGYYASVQDGKRRGLLLGPYPLKEVAEGMVAEARTRSSQVDDRSHWYSYGVARVSSVTSLPCGRLGR